MEFFVGGNGSALINALLSYFFFNLSLFSFQLPNILTNVARTCCRRPFPNCYTKVCKAWKKRYAMAAKLNFARASFTKVQIRNELNFHNRLNLRKHFSVL